MFLSFSQQCFFIKFVPNNMLFPFSRKMKLRFPVAVALLGLSLSSSGQCTDVYANPEGRFAEALMLYDAGMFGAARTAFADFQYLWSDDLDNSVLLSDAQYFEAVCAKLLENPDASQLLKQFAMQNQHSNRQDDAFYHLGDRQLTLGSPKRALPWLEKANEANVLDENRVPLLFKRGYCYFMLGNHELALAQFDKFKGNEGEFEPAVMYYRAHVDYENGNLDLALAKFLELEKDDGFATAASYYIADIFYLKGHYEQAMRYAKPLAEQGGSKCADMTRIVADSHFMLAEYDDASQAYERLFRLSGASISRADYYHMGICQYNLGNYSSAASYLGKVTSEQDAIAQNAYYHLGACSLKDNDKKKARTAFDAASRYDFDSSVTEDATFNKLKLSYELNFSAFDEIVTQFIDFLKKYPQSQHRDEALDLTGKALLSTKNYKQALETMEQIQHKNLALYKAMQRIAFYRGLELFTNQDFDGAQEFFAYSLKYGDYDALIKARALYWQGECLYSQKNIEEARDKYTAFINAYQASELSEFQTAHYNVGYTYYNKKDYVNSRRWFLRYVSLSGQKPANLMADAYNRLGDCLYVDRDFNHAVGYYNSAQLLSPAQGDYSMLQKGICYGLQGDNNGKIVVLDSLIGNYPKSVYADNAYFEKARAFVAMGDIKDAIYNYKVVKEKFPKCSLAPQAMLQLGLLYYNNSEYDNSMAFYKRVINEYPSTPEAADALSGLRNVYMENGDYDGYIAYTSTLGSFAHVSMNERDSLLFVSAQHHYFNSKFSEAKSSFRRYLETFPEGRYVTPANYYLADICYADKEYDQALSLYRLVADKPRSVFTEESLLRSGELLYKSDNFSDALTVFIRLENEAEVESNKIEAIIGQMRCLSKMGNVAKCIEGADKVIAMPQASPEILREALYLKAKSLIDSNRQSDAIGVLRDLASNTVSAEGAEAKYLLAQIYYDQNSPDLAEAEVFDYVEKGTPHQYWLARSFVLLADIYHDKGDDFQATQYLETLKESYSADDDISSMIADRVQAWAPQKSVVAESSQLE